MAKGIHQILGALGEARQLLNQRGSAVVEAHLARLQQGRDGMGARLRALTSGAA